MQSKRSGIVWLVQAVIQDLVGGSVKAARGKFTWQELFQLVHFVNFAVNFFVYSCCGRHFFIQKLEMRHITMTKLISGHFLTQSAMLHLAYHCAKKFCSSFRDISWVKV